MPRRKYRKILRVPDEGCCAFHPCDDCERCLAGDCCGADVGEAGLPLEGSWKYTAYGEVGVLDTRNDGKMKCHCCGEWYAFLGRHLQAHNLTADAYRAMWGLKCSQPLANDEIRQHRAELGAEHGHRVNEHRFEFTPEQRSMWAYKRESRAQRVRDRGEWPRDSSGKFIPRQPGRIMARRIKE